jgi:hypothetical protein
VIFSQGFPFIQDFLEAINEQLGKINPAYKLSWLQRRWITFCLMGILVTNTLCWTVFERYSLGHFSIGGLSWAFRKSKIFWEWLLLAAVQVILKKYGLSSGHLVIDDTDRSRSKSTQKIAWVHKIFDKKTNGYFMGQNLVILLLVTDKITLPVGFRFYQPDPKKQLWNKEDKKLREQKIPKSARPKAPQSDPAYPTKIEIALLLLAEFKKNFPEVKVTSINADAAYGSLAFFTGVSQLYPKNQIISQIKYNQLVLHHGKWKTVSDVFQSMQPTSTEVFIRGKEKKVTLVSARLKVKSHQQMQRVVALMYEGETDYRYLVAQDLSWRAIDVVQAYGNRWLVEVFNEDWKGHEGWGQFALQQGKEGSFRGVVLSFLLDLCLLFHPDQSTRIENKEPACTVGSLREQLKNESLLACFYDILTAEDPLKQFTEFKDACTEYCLTRPSSKHLVNRDLPELKPSPSLIKKFGKVKLCYA